MNPRMTNMKLIRSSLNRQWASKTRRKLFHLVLLSIFSAVLLSVSGCGSGGGSDNSAYVSRLESENKSLHSENERLKKQVQKDGYLLIATWLAGFSCVALFSVGLACGMKIKKSVLANEK